MLTRRAFVAGASAVVASSALKGHAAAPKARELVVGGLKTRNNATGDFAFYLIAIDASGAHACQATLDFHMHGFAPHPHAPERAVLFEKKGPGACEVDLRAGKMLRKLVAAPDCTFYGHGRYGADGAHLYVTESRSDGTGVITVRDGKSFALLGQFPSYGAEPHDCQLVDDSRVLAITNGGGVLDDAASPPSVTFVDVRTTKLVERVLIDEPRINAGHLVVTPKKQLVIVSAPRKGLPQSDLAGVSIRSGKTLLHMREPQVIKSRMIGETLSLAVHAPSSTAIATTPDANLLTFWSLEQRRMVRSMDLEHPRGVTVTRDQRYFVVSCGVAPKLLYLSTKTFEADATRTVEGANISSSHIYTHLV
jgi:hypothetical protein